MGSAASSKAGCGDDPKREDTDAKDPSEQNFHDIFGVASKHPRCTSDSSSSPNCLRNNAEDCYLRGISTWNVWGVPWESHRVFSRIGEWRTFNDTHFLSCLNSVSLIPSSSDTVSTPIGDQNTPFIVSCFQETFSFHQGGPLMDYTSRCDSEFAACSSSALSKHTLPESERLRMDKQRRSVSLQSESSMKDNKDDHDCPEFIDDSELISKNTRSSALSGTADGSGVSSSSSPPDIDEEPCSGLPSEVDQSAEQSSKSVGYGQSWEKFVIGMGVALRPFAFGRIWDAPQRLFDFTHKDKIDDQPSLVPFSEVVGSGGLSLKWSTLVDSGLCILSTKMSNDRGFVAYKNHPKKRSHEEHFANKGILWALWHDHYPLKMNHRDDSDHSDHSADEEKTMDPSSESSSSFFGTMTTLIINTHLTSNKPCKPKQLAELADFMEMKRSSVMKIISEYQRNQMDQCHTSIIKDGLVLSSIQIVLCGDFNLDPSMRKDSVLSDTVHGRLGMTHLTTGMPTSAKQSRALDHIWSSHYDLTVLRCNDECKKSTEMMRPGLEWIKRSLMREWPVIPVAPSPMIPWHIGEREGSHRPGEVIEPSDKPHSAAEVGDQGPLPVAAAASASHEREEEEEHTVKEDVTSSKDSQKKSPRKKGSKNEQTCCLKFRTDISDHCWQCVMFLPKSLESP